nr:signal peptidase II [uncultured Peptostreptococcus sp.]
MYKVLILVLVIIDQLSKWLVRTNLANRNSIGIIDGIFNLTYVENRGAAFGIFQNMKMFFAVVAILVIIAGLVYIDKSVSKNVNTTNKKSSLSKINKKSKLLKINRVAVAIVVAGAVGNLIDRLWLGYVVDFFDFRFIWSYVFNFADILVVVGTIIFCVMTFILGEDEN